MQKRIIIYGNTKIADVINGNPYVLLLQHFGIEDSLGEKSIDEISKEYLIPKNLFISFLNLYNGESAALTNAFLPDDLKVIISFLRSSHKYYLNEMFPKIGRLVSRLNKSSDKKHTDDSYNIKDYHKNHNDIEEKLNDLKNLLLKYYPTGSEFKTKKELLFRF